MHENKEALRRLAETQNAFTQWRIHEKQPGVRIPERLWNKAMDLLGDFSIARVASGLKLNGTELKNRAVAAGRLPDVPVKRRKKSSRSNLNEGPLPTFLKLEVTGGGSEPAPGQSASRNGWRLTWTRSDGGRLEVEPPALDLTQLDAMVHSFLGA